MEKLSTIKPLYNKVLIALVPMNDEVTLAGGMKIFLDTTFEPSDHVSVCGTVIQTPQKLLFSRRNPESMFWKTEIEILPGDTAYFDYHAVLMALGRKADKSILYPSELYFVEEDQLYVFLSYQDIFCVARQVDGETQIIPVNGYVIIQPTIEMIKEPDGIIVPYHLRRSQQQNKGVVLYIGKPNSEFLSPNIFDVDGYEVGDTVMYKQIKIRKLEYDLHATLPKGIIVVQRSDIDAVILPNT